MLPPVVAVVWGYLTVEGESAHVHESCNEKQGLMHMLRCPSIDLSQILDYKAESLCIATIMGKVGKSYIVVHFSFSRFHIYKLRFLS